MDNFGLQLKKLRKTKGLNQEDLAEILGVRKTTISNYETGYSGPSNSMLRQIAEYFGVTIGSLMGDTPVMQECLAPPQSDCRAIPVYASLNQNMANIVPLYYIHFPSAIMGEGDFFAIKILGDRMERAALTDGSLAIIRKQEFADNGEIVIVTTNNEPTFLARLYRFGENITLVAESNNPMYHPITVNTREQKVLIFGKVIQVIQTVS